MPKYASFIGDSTRWDGFPLRADDILICTPSKSGTTWVQMQVASLVLDTVELDRSLSWYSPWLDMLLEKREDVVARLEAQTHRRFIKSHTPLDGLPWDSSVTYLHVTRHPIAAAASFDDHRANMNHDRFLTLRAEAVGLDDLVGLAPPVEDPDDVRSPIRKWIEAPPPVTRSAASNSSLDEYLHHVRTFWEMRDEPNVHLFHYDDMIRDLDGQMRRLASALGIEPGLKFAEQVRACTFETMRANADKVVPNADQEAWVSPEAFFPSGGGRRRQDDIDPDDRAAFARRLAELVDPELAAWITDGSTTPAG